MKLYKTLRLCWSVLRLRCSVNLQYRAAAWAGIIAQFFWGFLYTMIYEAFYLSATVKPPMALEQLTAYIWLQQALLVFIILWLRDNQLFNLITSGDIAYELCRPCDLYGFWYAKLLGQRLSGALLRSVPLLLGAFFLPAPYCLLPPADGEALALFLLSLTLGLLVIVAISMFVYISVFITMSPAGSLFLFSIVGDFFAGLVLPIPLMPVWLQKVAYVLPFRLVADLPFRIYSGHILPAQAWQGVFWQIVWLSVLVSAGRLALRKALRRLVVQGG